MKHDVLDAVTLETGSAPNASVIWLHGLGADGYDFVPIVRELESLGAPSLRYVFPHAREIPVTINGGHVMRAWYDILGTELIRREDAAGILASAISVNQLIAREIAHGISSEHIVLAGFSQGGAIALQTALRHPARLAGVLALSTYLPLAGSLEKEKSTANQSVPIFMAHGTQDGVVPLARGTESRDKLLSLGYTVDWHEYPMQHSLAAEELRDIAAFLQRIAT